MSAPADTAAPAPSTPTPAAAPTPAPTPAPAAAEAKPAPSKPPFPGQRRRDTPSADSLEKIRAFREEQESKQAAAKATHEPAARQPELSAPHADAAEDVAKLAKDATTPKRETPAEPAKAEGDTTPAAKTFKMKRGQVERELPIDKVATTLGVPAAVLEQMPAEAVTKLYELRWDAEEGRRQNGEDRKQFDAFLSNLEGDPIAATEALLQHPKIHERTNRGMKEIATEYLARQYQRQNMTPEQLEAEDAKTELAQIKAQNARAFAEAEAAEKQRAWQEWNQNYVGEIRGHLKEAGEPDEMFDRALMYLQHERQREGDAYDAPQTAQQMKARASAAHKALRAHIAADVKREVGKMSAEDFMRDYPELTRAISDLRIATFRKNQAAQTQGPMDPADKIRRATTPRVDQAGRPIRNYIDLVRSWRD